jgi:DNA adenine methylase
MKPPVSYYGGKQRIASRIVPLIPKHTVYVEPFAGGAAVLFAKPWPAVTNGDHYREVVNDTDGRLVNFYRMLRDRGPELVAALQLTPFSEEEHQLAKDLDSGDELERARRYYVNISQSFSNTIGRGWSRNKNAAGNNHPVIWTNKIGRLPQYLDRMSTVYISSTDAIKCIQQWDSPHTFFYVDPPYPGANQGHYKGYTYEDFFWLCDTLDKIQGSFVLSNYFNKLAPAHWERYDIQTTMSASRQRDGTDRKRTEVLWRKLSTAPVRPEIQALYDSGKFDCFGGH